MNMRGRLPMVGHDIRSFSEIRDISVTDILNEDKTRRGRRAQSDQVACCLLSGEVRDAIPLLQVDRIGRNRRRVICLFVFLVAWWGLGHILM